MSRNLPFWPAENFFIFFKKVLAFLFFLCYYMQALERVRYALVAQLDRVTDYESVGRGFESLPAYQKDQIPFGIWSFCILVEEWDSKDSIAICRWHIAATSSKTGGYFNFCPLGRNVNESLA